MKELPSINQLYQEFKERGFVVLAVDIREPKGVVEKAVRERGYTFPVLLDSRAEVTLEYQVRATPPYTWSIAGGSRSLWP